MDSQRFSTLKGVVTPNIKVEVTKNDVYFAGGAFYIDADDELKKIAEYIKMNINHNSSINPERIKFLYTTKSKKDGGRFCLGQLILRTGLEKMVNDEYDYIITVFYKTWKDLDIENKVIQLDKLLCGISVQMEDSKKVSADSKEFTCNLREYGAEKVLNSSEIVDIKTLSFLEKEREEKAALKKKEKEGEEEREEDLSENE